MDALRRSSYRPTRMRKVALRTGSLLFVLAACCDGATFTVTTTADSGAGSLRQAITDANAAAGLDIVSPVLVDGYTQPGASPNTNAQAALNTVLKVVISAAAAPGQNGFVLSTGSDGSTVRGLVINGGFN